MSATVKFSEEIVGRIEAHCNKEVEYWISHCTEHEKNVDLDNINRASADPAFGYKMLEELANNFIQCDTNSDDHIDGEEFIKFQKLQQASEKKRGGFSGRYPGQDAELYLIINSLSPSEEGITMPEMIAFSEKHKEIKESVMRAAAARQP